MSNISRNRFTNLGALILFLLSWTVPIPFAQEHLGKGRITGTVVDEKGRPLEGVLIVVESLKSKIKRQDYSNKKGRFAVAGMGTGYWRITASMDGYISSTVDMNIRQLRKNPPINFTLMKITDLKDIKADKDSSQLFNRGELLLREKKYDEAIKIFEEFLKMHPEIYQVHLDIGTCYLKKGELDKAEFEFKKVLDNTVEKFGDYKKEPQVSFRAFTGLGKIYIQKKGFEEAQKYFAQALDISPEDEVAAYNVGEIFFSNKKIDEAVKYLELAIKIKKDWSKPYLKLGYVYLNKGDFNKSLEYFNKFIEIDPENPEVPNVKNIIAAIEKMKK